MGTWTPNLYFYGLWHIPLTFANILDRLFNTLKTYKQNSGSLLYPLATVYLATFNILYYFIKISGTQSVDWYGQHTWRSHPLVVMTRFSISLTLVDAPSNFWIATLGSDQNGTI